MKTLVKTSWAWFDKFYARFAKILLIFCMLAATGGVIIGTSAQLQSSGVSIANKKLTDCIRDWSTENSKVSKATRDAAAAKDVAVTAFNATLADEGDAFHGMVKLFLASIKDPESTDTEDYRLVILKLERTLQARSDANRVVIDAQNHLDKVRADNPIPAPPAEFCHLDGDEE
jgi:hypothetical protein